MRKIGLGLGLAATLLVGVSKDQANKINSELKLQKVNVQEHIELGEIGFLIDGFSDEDIKQVYTKKEIDAIKTALGESE